MNPRARLERLEAGSQMRSPSRTVGLWLNEGDDPDAVRSEALSEGRITDRDQVSVCPVAYQKGSGMNLAKEAPEKVAEIRGLREAGTIVPEIMRRKGFSKASVYRALRANLANEEDLLSFVARILPPVRLPCAEAVLHSALHSSRPSAPDQRVLWRQPFDLGSDHNGLRKGGRGNS